MLEYSKDLTIYSVCGPTDDELNYTVQCSSIRDMMEHLTKEDGPKVTAYFTHSHAILLHLTAMGAFAQGPKLTANFDKEAMNDREWNTSKLNPMATNFVAILYKDKTVKFFLNDKVLHLPLKGCKNGLCDVESLKGEFQQCKKQ